MAYKSEQRKKIFIWSTDDRKSVLGSLLKCYSSASGQSESSIIEGALIDALLPAHRDAQNIVRSLFLSDSLAHAYEAAFHYLEAGIDFKARQTNALPLVHAFFESIAYRSPRVCFPTDTGDYLYVMKHIRTIAELLRAESPAISGTLLDAIDGQCDYISIVTTLLSSWHHVGELSITYRILAALVRACPIVVEDEDIRRQRFVQVLREISTNWT